MRLRDAFIIKEDSSCSDIEEDVKDPTPETTIPPDAPYVVIDRQTKQVVYRTTWANRKRAKTFADKKDNEYGAYRYYPQLEKK